MMFQVKGVSIYSIQKLVLLREGVGQLPIGNLLLKQTSNQYSVVSPSSTTLSEVAGVINS